jgi:hypothetical protein
LGLTGLVFVSFRVGVSERDRAAQGPTWGIQKSLLKCFWGNPGTSRPKVENWLQKWGAGGAEILTQISIKMILFFS